jgi:hypothetical protein
MKSSLSQIKDSVENLSSRLYQMEERITLDEEKEDVVK